MNRERGVALIWVLVVSAILLLVSGTMVSYIVKESRFSVRIEDSVQSYSAAKSGIEWAKYYIETTRPRPTGTINRSFDLLGNDSIAETRVQIIADCEPSVNYCITSASSFNNVNRKLEFKITSPNAHTVTPAAVPEATVLGSLNGSFEMEFDFWGRYPVGVGVWGGGAACSANLSYTNPACSFIVMSEERPNLGGIDDNVDSIKLRMKTPGSGTLLESPDISFNIGDDLYPPADFPAGVQAELPYLYHAKIKYIKDTSASLTVYKNCALYSPDDPDDAPNYDPNADPHCAGVPSDYKCLGSATIDLSGQSFGTFTNLFTKDIVEWNCANYTCTGSFVEGWHGYETSWLPSDPTQQADSDGSHIRFAANAADPRFRTLIDNITIDF